MLGYKDLDVTSKDKSILDVEWPDIMIYQPLYLFPPEIHGPLKPSPRLQPQELLGPPRPASLTHFHHPETICPDPNNYKKLSFHKQRGYMEATLRATLSLRTSSWSQPIPCSPAPCFQSASQDQNQLLAMSPPHTHTGHFGDRIEEVEDISQGGKGRREKRKWWFQKGEEDSEDQREELSKVTSSLEKMTLK